jgi:hypothetical protein
MGRISEAWPELALSRREFSRVLSSQKIGWHLAAIGGKLLHYLLVQPDVHLR